MTLSSAERPHKCFCTADSLRDLPPDLFRLSEFHRIFLFRRVPLIFEQPLETIRSLHQPLRPAEPCLRCPLAFLKILLALQPEQIICKVPAEFRRHVVLSACRLSIAATTPVSLLLPPHCLGLQYDEHQKLFWPFC